MDTKQMTTMVVGLVISVMLVAGLMVPVISSLDNSGEGFTNTGEYYYKEAKEGENHTLAIDSSDDAVTVTYDGVLIHTLTKGLTGWSLPLFSYVYADEFEALCSLYYYVDVSSSKELDKRIDFYGVVLNYDGEDSYNIPVTFNIVGKTITDQDHPTPSELNFYLANEGELVYSESPIVSEDQVIYSVDMYQNLDPNENPINIKYVGINGFGTVNTIANGKTTTETPDGIFIPGAEYDWETYDMPGFVYKDWFDCQSSYGWQDGDIVMNSTDTEYGRKIDSIDLTIRWDNANNPIQNVSITKFIVPVEVGESGGSGISPTMMNLLSVIPLITVVGIIIGMVSYMKMRD